MELEKQLRGEIKSKLIGVINRGVHTPLTQSNDIDWFIALIEQEKLKAKVEELRMLPGLTKRRTDPLGSEYDKGWNAYRSYVLKRQEELESESV